MKRKRPQEQAKNIARMSAKKARLLKLCVQEGKTIRAASKILKKEGFEKGASKSAVGVALKQIERDFSKIVPAEREKAYDRLNGWLEELETAKNTGQLDLRASISDGLAVMDRLSRLLGTDAPTKSVSATFNGDVDPATLIGYRKFVSVTNNMDQATLSRVYEFAAKLNGAPAPPVIGPPASSELWEDKESYMSDGKVYRLEGE
jgi:hypothetical protein